MVQTRMASAGLVRAGALTAALTAAVMAAAPLAAAETAPVAGTLLTVTAEGRSVRAPDLVEMSGGVVSEAPTAAAAMAANARAMTAVVAAVRRAGIASGDIQTQGLSLQAQYHYEQNQPPRLTGYQASNTIALRVRRLDQAGPLLDTLVTAGANRIDGPTFRVENAAAALDAARAEAVATARSRAQLYARAAGLAVKRIVSISEGGALPEARPMMMRAAMADAAPAPPVEPGSVDLAVQVTVAFELE